MARLRRLGPVLALALPLPGCPAGTRERPPPAESLDIASAAPGALGALAGGTDAAPPVSALRRTPQADDPFGLEQEQEAPEIDGGVEEDAGPQQAPEHVPL